MPMMLPAEYNKLLQVCAYLRARVAELEAEKDRWKNVWRENEDDFPDNIKRDWKWHCASCGTLTNDGECDCTKFANTATTQRLVRLGP